MSGPGVGFEYPAQEVSWLKRDALLFANSIGCTADELHFLFVRLSMSLEVLTNLFPLGTPPKVPSLPYLSNNPPYARVSMFLCFASFN